MLNYDSKCQGCKLSQGRLTIPGGIVPLDEYWVLNHYQDPQAFLGWLILQPYQHTMSWGGLRPKALTLLGGDVKKIEKHLREYWLDKFDDPIQRLYVVYFHEGVFDRIRQRKEKARKWHLHIHLIPRPKSFDPLLRRYDREGSIINAWEIYSLREKCKISEEYYPLKNRRSELMRFLRQKLHSKE